MNFIGLMIFKVFVVSLGLTGFYTMPTDDTWETKAQCEAYVYSENIKPEIAASVKLIQSPNHRDVVLTNVLCLPIESTPL